ncbi:TPA: hypothetical protein N0F65_002002 [Lagenidium giganteum]|uniref:UDENN domain-containing protein n=1 Tax=Lagenidium giganteum TaxID=4803 RepID=A0AAV2Z3L9_9STRA|nr:TPA: hypothetical protein N0F65_002002 [Lagenidium giganteum]
MASARSTSVYTDKDDFQLTNRSDSVTFSFSSRSTFRRSTISEQMLHETELFEPERELSVRELSEVLTAKDEEIKSIEVTSIKEEEQDAKLEYAKSRWAQHVKLKARNFIFSTMTGKGPGQTPSAPSSTTSNSHSATANNSWSGARTRSVVSPGAMTAAFLAQQQQHQQHHHPSSSHQGYEEQHFGIAGAATFQKWNRWMHDQYQNNINKVLQRAFKEDFIIGQSPEDPMGLISIEEVVSNPRMMRYYAAWLQDVADQSKLFFLCSFEEYRQFWCTLRANYLQKEASAGHGVPFSKEDVLLLRTYGVKIAQKYLARSAQFQIGSDLVDNDILRIIKRDIATGGEDALRTFDHLCSRVKRILMDKFPEFRKTELYAEMHKSVEREVICLEDILMNHRFANFFWLFLFPHNYHREIALWLDVEYEFKPAYRTYIGLLKTPGRRKEKKDQAALQCRKLLRYISQKYYAGDSDMSDLEKSLTTSCSRLQSEQDAIISKFSIIHLELYHRFLTSHAYTEFSLYPKVPEGEDGMDDSRRLSSLLLSYGLRAHFWPEDASRESQKKRSLEVLHTSRGYEAICGVLTFEAMLSENSAEPGSIELRVMQHPLPHDPTPQPIDKSIETFLIPWCQDPHFVVLTAPTCPAPVAFNFRMGDNSSASSSELYAACVIIYKPAPILPSKHFERVRLESKGGCRWVPYGICILSRFALVDLLRERLAEAYEFIVEIEAIEAANKASNPTPVSVLRKEPFQIDKKLLSKLARAVSLENGAPYGIASVPPPQSVPVGLGLPKIDHSVRMLFDTLDISTVLLVFTAALLEGRIILVSSYLSVLMRVGESLKALLYPLLWPHVYLPVLPRRMLQYLECPTPFIFGVEKDALDEETKREYLSEDVVAVDLDKGCVMHGVVPCTLPQSVLYELRESLYECLKPNVSKSDHVFAHHFPSKPLVFPDHQVRSLFYDTVRKLIGDFGYHRYVWTDEYSNKKTVFFDEASYLAASSPAKREFRTLFIATQAFSEFMVSYHGFEDKIGPPKPARAASVEV